MRKQRIMFLKELIKENKKQILSNKNELKRIEEKVEEKYCQKLKAFS